jgi:hypothetical protein
MCINEIASLRSSNFRSSLVLITPSHKSLKKKAISFKKAALPTIRTKYVQNIVLFW